MNYLPVDVYTNGQDSTNNGVSKTHRLVVPHENGHVTAEQVAEQGYIIMDVEVKGRVEEPYHYAREHGQTRWTMMGGNFIYSSDSRFRRTYGDRPLPVHDRIEN
jgi:hypothetical protein